MPSSSFSLDAAVYPRRFTLDAWVLGQRQRHHRVRDHFGIESDLYVALSADIGPYVAYTPIHFIIADLVDRIWWLENANRTRATFSADAWLAISGTYGRGVIFTNAVVKDLDVSSSFTADAVLMTGGVFTLDAYINGVFTINAFIV